MKPNDEILALAEDYGADLFGVADLTEAQEFILWQGGSRVAGYPRAVSIGITLLHPIVDQLPRREEKAVAVEYRHHAYDVINDRLDDISSRLSGALQARGYRALPISASGRADDDKIAATFSHKLAAHLAGLGWIGKSCLLITPQAGPRVRWTTVLTDAPLSPTGKPMEEQCGDCRECEKICPAGAILGRPFRDDEPRETRYDARKCEQYFRDMEKNGDVGVCGMCVYICPYGRKNDAD
ncbi:Epoxyqueuosine reductase [uncultured archaeon]|nr:Epoxyqueuosine reductase [uncultured archaeon]